MNERYVGKYIYEYEYEYECYVDPLTKKVHSIVKVWVFRFQPKKGVSLLYCVNGDYHCPIID